MKINWIEVVYHPKIKDAILRFIKEHKMDYEAEDKAMMQKVNDMRSMQERIMVANEFHFGECKKIIGPRGGIKYKQEIWRRNGRTKTWKTRPGEFRIPIKTGFRGPYSYISHTDINLDCNFGFHIAEDCPLYRSDNDKT